MGQYSKRTITNYAIRRLAVDFGVPLITNLQVAALFAESIASLGLDPSDASISKLDVKSMQEHYDLSRSLEGGSRETAATVSAGSEDQ